MEEAYARAREIIEANNDKINAMADMLLEKETIYTEDIETILGPSAQSKKDAAEKADTQAEITSEPATTAPSEATEAEKSVNAKTE